MTTTVAERIGALYGNDGQKSQGLEEACVARGGRAVLWGYDWEKWRFPDGSAIVVQAGVWDYALDPADDGCHCWEGEGEHNATCAQGATP